MYCTQAKKDNTLYLKDPDSVIDVNKCVEIEETNFAQKGHAKLNG